MDLTDRQLRRSVRLRAQARISARKACIEAWLDTTRICRAPQRRLPTSWSKTVEAMPGARCPNERRRTEAFAGFDGSPLAVHRLGAGRPVAAAPRPVLRARDQLDQVRPRAARWPTRGSRRSCPICARTATSAKPHDPAAYPPDVLVRDAEALVEALGLDRLRSGRLLARRAHRGARRDRRARAAPAGAGAEWVSKDWPGGTAAQRSSSMRSTGSTGEARRPGVLRGQLHEDEEDRPRGGAAAAAIGRRHRSGRARADHHAHAGAVRRAGPRQRSTRRRWPRRCPMRVATRCPART